MEPGISPVPQIAKRLARQICEPVLVDNLYRILTGAGSRNWQLLVVCGRGFLGICDRAQGAGDGTDRNQRLDAQRELPFIGAQPDQHSAFALEQSVKNFRLEAESFKRSHRGLHLFARLHLDHHVLRLRAIVNRQFNRVADFSFWRRR